MAQGAAKKTPKANTGKTSRTHGQKKNTGVTKQKRAKSSADKLQKKISSGMTARTEKLLAERAGHLELLGRTKKGEKGADGVTKHKGGTRKFG